MNMRRVKRSRASIRFTAQLFALLSPTGYRTICGAQFCSLRGSLRDGRGDIADLRGGAEDRGFENDIELGIGSAGDLDGGFAILKSGFGGLHGPGAAREFCGNRRCRPFRWCARRSPRKPIRFEPAHRRWRPAESLSRRRAVHRAGKVVQAAELPRQAGRARRD